MMIAAISETIRYILTLLFGVLVTAGPYSALSISACRVF